MSNKKFSSAIKKKSEKLKSLISNIKEKKDREKSIEESIKLFQQLQKIGSANSIKVLYSESQKTINLLNFINDNDDPLEKEFLKEIDESLKTIDNSLDKSTKEIEKNEQVQEIDKKDEFDEDSKELINSFISEGDDLLSDMDVNIGNFDENPDPETVNTIFRCFHSLKGMAGFLNFNSVREVTHEAETLLDIFREDISLKTDNDLDLLYETTDFLKLLVKNVSTNYTDKGLESEAKELVSKLSERIKQLKGTEESEGIDLTEKKSDPVELQKSDIEPAELEFDDISESNPEMTKQYISESLDQLENIDKNLLILENDFSDKETIKVLFRDVHSLKGNSGLMGLVDVEEVCMTIENLLNDVRSEQLKLSAKIITTLLKDFDIIKKAIETIDHKEKIIKIEILEKEEISHEIGQYIGTAKSDLLGDVLVEMGATSKKDINKALKIQERKKELTQAKIKRKDIRVDTTKLDKLFNLVGELLTIEAMITNNSDIKKLQIQSFIKSSSMLNKITRELQEVTTSIRMTPLEGLFNRMKRLIRDLSRKSGKKINFSIKGQETEMDKNIIQDITDPLIHLLRNAADHGVEDQKTREAKGKSKEGNVSLVAEYEGNEILIIIKDDGAGLNKEKILKKAKEKGFIKGKLENLSDKDIWKFIFEPGFSTAKVISEVSGRGVGMDVVKKNIEKLRGNIDVESKKNKGTTFKLKIPLTLAMMDVMLLRVGPTIYAVPITSIKENFKPLKKMLTVTMDGQEVVKLRDELFSVIRLHEQYNLNPDYEKLEDGILVLVEAHEKKVCFFVDEIIGQQQTVVKGLSEYIGNVHGLTGSMILSDGGIGLILDVEGIIETYQKKSN